MLDGEALQHRLAAKMVLASLVITRRFLEEATADGGRKRLVPGRLRSVTWRRFRMPRVLRLESHRHDIEALKVENKNRGSGTSGGLVLGHPRLLMDGHQEALINPKYVVYIHNPYT